MESSLGDGRKRPTFGELETRLVVRRRLLAARSLRAGTTIAESDLKLRRAGEGLGADALPHVIGRRLLHDLEEDAPLTWDELG